MTFRVVLLAENIEQRKRRNTQSATRKIDVAIEKNIEGCLQPIIETVIFYYSGKKYRTIEVKFATEKMQKST